MTLILTLVTPFAALQVGDRLVSVGSKVHDPEANKSLILRGANGLVTIAYSGFAYLDGAPADHWIAEQLADDVFPLAFGTRVGGSRKPETLGQAVIRLRRRLVTEFSKSGAPKPPNQEIIVAGLQWKNLRVKPFVAQTKNSTLVPGGFTTHFWPRHRFLPTKSQDQLILPIWTFETPEGWLTKEERAGLMQNLTPWDIDACERMFVDSIRVVAARSHNRVGADCMSILIHSEDSLHMRIRYLPETKLVVPLRLDQSIVQVPAAYTPWYISQNMVQQPQIMVGGGGEWNIEGVKTYYDVPALPQGSSIAFGLFVQPRRPDIRTRRRNETPPPFMPPVAG